MPKPTKVLAVDDREENLIALAAVLDALPVDLVLASSGEEALRELLTDDFALILLDVVMPEMDGFETAGRIKARPRTRDIPIIFLTAGGASGEQAYRGYAAGAVDYLTKPFDPWLLRAKVSIFVELHRRTERLRGQAELLRRTLEDDAAGAGGAADGAERVLKALDERLVLIEEDVARQQAGLPAEELPDHVAELRAALEAFSAGQ
ncbi:response regulator [Spirillospora albida]|uniref:response regulator n=1 Tax=Spirillospora albida TaxID=58123 RepID=UPI0004BFD98F|nr:response regulator [Spirillospora albida]